MKYSRGVTLAYFTRRDTNESDNDETRDDQIIQNVSLEGNIFIKYSIKVIGNLR